MLYHSGSFLIPRKPSALNSRLCPFPSPAVVEPTLSDRRGRESGISVLCTCFVFSVVLPQRQPSNTEKTTNESHHLNSSPRNYPAQVDIPRPTTSTSNQSPHPPPDLQRFARYGSIRCSIPICPHASREGPPLACLPARMHSLGRAKLVRGRGRCDRLSRCVAGERSCFSGWPGLGSFPWNFLSRLQKINPHISRLLPAPRRIM